MAKSSDQQTSVQQAADLKSVVVAKLSDETWQAVHVPSGKRTTGDSAASAQQAMRELLGMDEAGRFSAEPSTKDRFSGRAREVAEFLEGPVTEMLAIHSGFARLEALDGGVAQIRLGGGCSGCPSSTLTLVHGVKQQLQEKFGEEEIADVMPVL